MKRIIFIISLIMCGITATHADVEHTFSIDFNLADFNITYDGDLVRVEPKSIEYNYPDDQFAPALPFKAIDVINDFSMKTTAVTPQYTLERIASGVQINAMGLPLTTNQVADPNEPAPIATQSQMQAVELFNGCSIQNGVSFAPIAASPFLYDNDTRTLYFIRKLTFTVTQSPIEGFDVANTVIRIDRFNASGRLNQEALAQYRKNVKNPKLINMPDHLPFDYLIITHDSLVSAYDELVRWKNQKGVRTRVAPLSEVYSKYQQYGRPEANIKLYIKDCYENHNIKYVLLGADHPIIPAVEIFHDLEIIRRDTVIDPFSPSDLFYACFNNNLLWDANGNGILGEPTDDIDLLPEIIVSRFPAHNRSDVTAMVNKILQYEITPPQSNYVKTMAMVGEKLSKYVDDITDAQYMSIGNYNTHIAPYWDGKLTTMFHNGHANDYPFVVENFKRLIDGEYNNNNGIHILDVRSHGWYASWTCFLNADSIGGYSYNDALSQTNRNPTIMLTSACYTNRFHKLNPDYTSLSEYLLRSKYGALSFIGSTTIGIFGSTNYKTPLWSLRYDSYFYENIFNTNIEGYRNNIGYIHQKALMSLSSTNPNRYTDNRLLYCCISLMGDPEMPIYTEDPTPFDVSINIDDTLGYVVKVNGESVEDEVLTISDGKREPSLQLNLQDTYEANYVDTTDIIVVTVTGRNKVPFIYEPTTFKTLHIREREIDVSKEYWADDVIIGENVTVKSGAKLVIHAKNSIRMLDNVKAEEGATVQIGFN